MKASAIELSAEEVTATELATEEVTAMGSPVTKVINGSVDIQNGNGKSIKSTDGNNYFDKQKQHF